MTWFRVDDNLYDHPKWIGASLEARGLWLHCAVWCSRQLTDGRVPADALDVLGVGAKIPVDRVAAAAAELVKRGLWRKVRGAGGGFEFHEWLELQPSREEVTKQRGRWARMKRLYRDADLVARIKARDGDECRYCGREVRWGDRRSASGAVFDHVDPNLDDPVVNDPTNVVVACRSCNGRKGERTPAEAEMTLRPAPLRLAVFGDGPETDRTSPTHGTGRDSGTERNGVGPGGLRLVESDWVPPSDEDVLRWESEVVG